MGPFFIVVIRKAVRPLSRLPPSSFHQLKHLRPEVFVTFCFPFFFWTLPSESFGVGSQTRRPLFDAPLEMSPQRFPLIIGPDPQPTSLYLS